MPQMMPLNWLFLLFMCLMCMIILMILIHPTFLNSKIKKMKINKNLWKFKW